MMFGSHASICSIGKKIQVVYVELSLVFTATVFIMLIILVLLIIITQYGA